MEMTKKQAIDYLEQKGMIREPKKVIKIVKPKYSKKEKKEIERVMKIGKIYGDPLVELY